LRKYFGIIAASGFLFVALVFSLQQGLATSEKKNSSSEQQVTSSQTSDSQSAQSVSGSLESVEQTTDTTKEDTNFPKVASDDWSLVLVGPLHKGKEIDTDSLAKLSNGYMVDKRIVSNYENLKTAAEKAGHPLVMISAFRSISSQKSVFNQNVDMLMSQGQSNKQAIETTKRTMTEPGYSEHHTGLAVDVVDRQWYNSYTDSVLDHKFGETDGGKWLQEHAREYGFIIRYPEGKYDITKIDYEPWHLRYVGVEVATYIEEHKLTLEEFLEQVKEQEEEHE
jgi:D-alanyl-D-alanine carboxypeptidase